MFYICNNNQTNKKTYIHTKEYHFSFLEQKEIKTSTLVMDLKKIKWFGALGSVSKWVNLETLKMYDALFVEYIV